jgi:hypothetical protein
MFYDTKNNNSLSIGFGLSSRKMQKCLSAKAERHDKQVLSPISQSKALCELAPFQ